MKHQDALMGGWRRRTGPACEQQQFPDPVRQRIASLFMEATDPQHTAEDAASPAASLERWSAELVTLGTDSGLSAPDFCAELRNCQLSLVDILIGKALLSESQADTSSSEQARLQSIARLMSCLDELIIQSSGKLDADEAAGGSVTPGIGVGKKKKTLQHEIRTPLQGALLTTELMLEDAAQGDPVSADDILAVRKSIETAVSILNDFASHSGAH